MDKNYIISFANQKGGVGKTTLCILFANYLASKGKKVIVVDCDSQSSIAAKRTQDRTKYPESPEGYEIRRMDLRERAKVKREMDSLRSQDAVILLDTPGNLQEEGLTVLFSMSDYIIVPFQFEAISIQSTGIFITFIQRLRRLSEAMTGEMIFIVNDWDSRNGTRAEIDIWDRTEATLARLGRVAPRVKRRVDMQRVNTMFLMGEQSSIVSPTFDYIFNRCMYPMPETAEGEETPKPDYINE
jgi:chromosome partitioning protein